MTSWNGRSSGRSTTCSGLIGSGRLTARSGFLYVDPDGMPWYVATRDQLASWLRVGNPNRIRYAVERLVKKGLLCSVPHTRGRKRNTVAMRLRVNWPAVEAAFADWASTVEDAMG